MQVLHAPSLLDELDAEPIEKPWMAGRSAIAAEVRDRRDDRRVEVPRLVRHPKFGKIVKRKTVCHVHDEQNTSHKGDLVEIEECRPLSRLKRWTLVRVVAKGGVEAQHEAAETKT
jgi:ribosomal protein S17